MTYVIERFKCFGAISLLEEKILKYKKPEIITNQQYIEIQLREGSEGLAIRVYWHSNGWIELTNLRDGTCRILSTIGITRLIEEVKI